MFGKKKRKAFRLTQQEAAGMCNVGIRFLSYSNWGQSKIKIILII